MHPTLVFNASLPTKEAIPNAEPFTSNSTSWIHCHNSSITHEAASLWGSRDTFNGKAQGSSVISKVSKSSTYSYKEERAFFERCVIMRRLS